MARADLLVLGAGGLLGSAVADAARARGLGVETLARSSGDHRLDIADAPALQACLSRLQPRLIVNAAALVSVAACEADPGRAWCVNARPAAVIAEHARRTGARVLHVSTDHFFSGEGRRRHDEAAPVRLLNDYARSKYAAEALALTHADTLVVRTNMVGVRSATGGSFGEWALRVISEDLPATLFDDQYVSLLDVWSLVRALLDVADGPATGVLNVASREVFSKAEFVHRLALRLGRTLTRARPGGVGGQAVARPDSLGLDVSRAEALLGRRLPGLDEVVEALAAHVVLKREAAHALAL